MKKNEMDGAYSTCGREDSCIYIYIYIYIWLWWGNLRERNYVEDQGIGGRIILKWIYEKWDGTWTGLIWFRLGRAGGLL